jgi:5-methyltetrahydropteroyltriglutamate--homocysteine methyltransferase
MLMPGVVSHATNLVEHPQLVTDRILRYAAIAGRENIIAGTDCGLGVSCSVVCSCPPGAYMRSCA